MKPYHFKTFGVIVIIGAIVAVLGIGVSVQRGARQGFMGGPLPQQTGHPDILVSNIIPGQTITLPVTVSGNVKGNWFFEGSFPVFLKDAQGNQIGVGLASSPENWMTTDSIPFSVVLPSVNYQGQGSLVFTKDNPSGEPQFDDSFTIQVIFQ